MNKYIGHYSQISRVEKHTINSGKAKNYEILEVLNGVGLSLTISLERGGDIVRANCNGINCGFFSPCGYVSSSYYDDKDLGFLKSFTAGFLTTCGLYAVGTPCVDNGELLPLHGSINNTPADYYSFSETEDNIKIDIFINSSMLTSYKLQLKREYIISKKSNSFSLSDTVENIGDMITPCMILYHTNIGYPLLTENTELNINSTKITPRNKLANDNIDESSLIKKPQPGYTERCYYHEFNGDPKISLYNANINLGLTIKYNNDNLKYFTQWNNFRNNEYVLGLEPGNCLPDGRDIMREKGLLTQLKMGEKVNYKIEYSFFKKEINR